MEKINARYTIHIIWNRGCTDDVQVTSNTMANIVLNLLLSEDFMEVSVYKDKDKENALFYVLNGEYTARAFDGYWKIPL